MTTIFYFITMIELLNFSKRLSGSVLPSSRSTVKSSNQVGAHFILNIFKDYIFCLLVTLDNAY